jgi:hypothetical protein
MMLATDVDVTILTFYCGIAVSIGVRMSNVSGKFVEETKHTF